MMLKIGFLGPEGSYSELAAKIWKDRGNLKNVHFVSSDTIPYLVENTEKGNLDYSIIPLENSIEGTVNISIDALIRTEAKIVGEVIIKVNHCLAVRPETEKINLKTIYSHAQALSQCYHYLMSNFPEIQLKAVNSTSEAAKLVAESRENCGAICSVQAALKYNLKIIAENIQDYPDNKTRFIVLSKNDCEPGIKNKTTLVIALPENKPGVLYKVLKEFAEYQINLTKIESRPTKKELGEYLFIIECIGHIQDYELNKVLTNLAAQAVLLKILGSYPVDEEGYK